MSDTMLKRIFVLPLFMSMLLALGACTENTEEGFGEDPSINAIAMFNAIYIEKDVPKAAKLSGPQLARIMRHYKTPRGVARHVFNLPYEDDVEIKHDSSGSAMREVYDDETEVLLIFKGTIQGRKHDDLRTVVMEKRRGDWVVKEIKADKFL